MVKVLKPPGNVYGTLKKRVYVSDLLVLKAAAEQKNGAVYTRHVASSLNLSVRRVNGHFSKLESMGFIERYGQRRCPFQCYRVTRALDGPVHGLLEHGLELVRRLPGRFYFVFEFVSATRPSSYVQQRLPGFAGDRSIPFGERLPGMRGAHVVAERVSVVFWVPFDVECDDSLFEQLFDDLERFGVDYAFSDDYEVPVEWALDDGFGL